MKEDVEDFKKHINQRLTETTAELATQTMRITETEQRRAIKLEHRDKRSSASIIKQQWIVQSMLTDQEGRNRQKIIHIFGLKEGAEGSSVTQFIEQPWNGLPLPTNMDLQIQRVHWASLHTKKCLVIFITQPLGSCGFSADWVVFIQGWVKYFDPTDWVEDICGLQIWAGWGEPSSPSSLRPGKTM